MACVTGDKIRVLMVLGNTGRGGAQAYAINVLNAIDHEHFQIDFAVNYCHPDGYDATIKRHGGAIHIVPKFKGVNLYSYLREWRKILRMGNYDIVHGHVSSTAFLYLRLAKKYSCATIAHSHSAGYRGNRFVQIVKKLLTPGAKKYADYWFSCSELAAARMFGNDYQKNPRHYIMPNAILATNYLFDVEIRRRIRNDLSIDNDTLLFGHVGTFSQPKNHRFIVEIFSEVKKSQHLKAKLLLIGDGALRSEIENEVDRRGLHDSVIFTGNVGNVNEYLMAMDALVFPSFFEGLPLTLLEAQASGLYSVVSDRITSQVFLNECMVSMPLEANAGEWAKKLISIPTINRAEMNGAVSKSAFNMQQSIAQLMLLYEKMLKRKVG